MELTDANIQATTCPPGRKDALLFDDRLPGFGLRVTNKGKRVFIFQYRAGAKVRRTVLGPWGVGTKKDAGLSAAAARKKAESLRGQVRDARDPVAERRTAKAEAARVEAKEKLEAAAAQYTVDALITQWTDLHLVERSASYRKRVPAELRRILKTWVKVPAKDFTRIDAVQALDATKSKSGPIAANRARAEARACWAWAVKRGALAANPWEATPKPSVETARERVLTDLELADVWHAAGAMDDPWRGLFRVMILTGQRRGEVAGMLWDELDLDNGVWTMPGDRTKNGRGHTLPLAREVVALIQALPRREGATLVFEGARKTTPSGFGKLKAKLDEGMVKRATERDAKFVAWTLHDIRRTFATGLQKLGVRLEVTEAILNHVSGSRAGIVGVYQRHGWEREKVEALTAWTAHVLAIAEASATMSEDAPSPKRSKLGKGPAS